MKMSSSPGSSANSGNELEPLDDEPKTDLLNKSEKMFVFTPAVGMEGWISRNGILCKKTSDGTRYIRLSTYRPGVPRTYTRNPRTHSPNGSLIIHRDDEDTSPGTCKAIIHPPIASELEYRREDEGPYYVMTSLAKLITGSKDCEFCYILLQGINEFAEDWKPKWDELRWIESQFVQYRYMADEIPRIFPEQAVDTEVAMVRISFGRGRTKLEVRLQVPPISHAEVGRWENIYKLDFYSDPDKPSHWKAFPPSPHISSDVLSTSTIALFQKWIHNCRQNHQICNTIPVARPPTRLLRITSAPKSGDPTLQLFHTSPTEQYTYVALSHCWYYTRPLRTTATTIAAHLDSVPWDSLSPVFRDTVHLCLCLGYDYIWIDSLCILQGDAADFATEAPHMGHIYAQAALVIAAHGFELNLARDGTRQIDTPPLQESKDPCPAVFVRRIPDHDNMFNPAQETTTYWGRGWCFQERLFAPRILHFGGSYEEAYFECGEMVDCECQRIPEEKFGGVENTQGHLKRRLPTALRAFDTAVASFTPSTSSQSTTGAEPHADPGAEAASVSDELVPMVPTGGTEDVEKARNELWETYIALIEDYSAKGLTYSTDILPASSSLAKAISPRLGAYYAGLWSHNLLLGLQWEAFQTRDSSRPAAGTYLAPSWSWASRTGAVVWYYFPGAIPTAQTHEFAEVLHVQCELAMNDPFGPVLAGEIRLRGRTTMMWLDDGEEKVPRYRPDGRIMLYRPGAECFAVLDTWDDYEELRPGDGVLCLDIMRNRTRIHGEVFVSGLVLRGSELGGSRRGWRRIGFATMTAECFEGPGTEEAEEVLIF